MAETKGSLIPALALGAIGGGLVYAATRSKLANPRQLTLTEKFVLQPFVSEKSKNLLSEDALDTAVLHFGADMPDAMGGGQVQAYTDKTGIYFPFSNHEFETAEGYALLAHELLHWRHFIESGKLHESCTEEMPAYQLQMTVWQYLEGDDV